MGSIMKLSDVFDKATLPLVMLLFAGMGATFLTATCVLALMFIFKLPLIVAFFGGVAFALAAHETWVEAGELAPLAMVIYLTFIHR